LGEKKGSHERREDFFHEWFSRMTGKGAVIWDNFSGPSNHLIILKLAVKNYNIFLKFNCQNDVWMPVNLIPFFILVTAFTPKTKKQYPAVILHTVVGSIVKSLTCCQ
jgi:hypothetical protein